MPQPELTATQTEHTIRKVCGPDNKLSGLLPGSGPDIDKMTSTNHETPADADLIGIGGSGALDPNDPDTLDGDVVLPAQPTRRGLSSTAH